MPQSWLIRADSILVGSGLAFLFLLKGQSAGSWAAPPHFFGDSSNITTDIGRKIQRNYTTSDGLLADHLLYRPSTCFLGALARDLVLLTPPSASTPLRSHFYCVAVMNISHRKAQLPQPEQGISLFRRKGHTFVTCKKIKKKSSRYQEAVFKFTKPCCCQLKKYIFC